MTTGLIVGWLLGAGCMMLRDYYQDRAHRATLRALRERDRAQRATMRSMRDRVLADVDASRRHTKVLAAPNWPQVDQEAASHAASRDRRGSTLET